MRKLGFGLLAAAALAGTVFFGQEPLLAEEKAPAASAGATNDRPAWDDETLELFKRVPVQDGGRVKPLSTFADFTLLRVHGKRTYKDEAGKKHSATEWLLDCLFFPDYAAEIPVFRVQNDEVLDAVNLDHKGKKKRDTYSFAELAPAVDRIMQLGTEYQSIERGKRTPVQAQVVHLARNVNDFQRLIHFLDFARRTYPTGGDPELEALFDGSAQASFSNVLVHGSEIAALASQPHDHGDDGHGHGHGGASSYDNLYRALEIGASRAQVLALFPPGPDPEMKEWLSPFDVAQLSFGRGAELDTQIGALADLEAMVALRSDPAAFKQHAESFHKATSTLADERGEYRKVPIEVSYYKGDYFTRALVMFLLGFVAISLTWLAPRSKVLGKLAPWPVVAGCVLVAVGITMRCIIRGRPPVSTLYETILFITGTAVLVGLAAEWINRKRVALAMSSVFGSLGMFLAFKYETHEGVDTMPSLVAVLDTNFWLATHVTTVTIGYSAGLLAGFVAHVWLLGKLLGFKSGDSGFYKTVTRMTYGMLCFSLVFSVVGTVLGGIWANDSWGRFWGWDPKENGALLICLWQLAVLHARMGGYIRDRGLAIAAVFGGCVVAFSWWGVNLLEIGLHSYGFTSGAAYGLQVFYGIEAFVIVLATGHWLATRNATQAVPTQPPAPPVPPSPTA
jgi:ABC-type transport system involved in cytochrome c biogenesis permease subunit